MKWKFAPRLSVLVAVMLVSVVVLSACGGKASENAGTGGQSAAPTTISIMSTFFTPEPPDDNDPIKQEIEKRTNTKLDITWVSPNNYTEKSSVTLASGDIPDMLLVLNPFDPQIKIMAKQGAFWDLTPLLPEYKNLSEQFPQASWDNLKMEGKNYGIPRVRPVVGGGSMPLLRNDWIEALGLKYPETMDELYAVLKAMTEQDPDGNGKNDTVGLAINAGADNMGNLEFVENVFNRSFGPWKLKDGKLTHTALEPETKQALQWLVNAYKDGIISADFATLKATQLRDLVKANKAGGWIDAVKPSWLLTGEMRKANPNADLLAAPYLAGPLGKFAPEEAGNYGMFVIPKTVKEDKVKKILSFMDYGASREGWVLANFGLENTHHTAEEDLLTFTEEGKQVMGRSGMPQIIANLDKYERAVQVGIPIDFYKRNQQVIDERATVAVKNEAYGLSSDTFDKYGKEYEKKMTDLKVKIILGNEPIEAWDKYVESLKKDAQFMKMIDEMDAALKAK